MARELKKCIHYNPKTKECKMSKCPNKVKGLCDQVDGLIQDRHKFQDVENYEPAVNYVIVLGG